MCVFTLVEGYVELEEAPSEGRWLVSYRGRWGATAWSKAEQGTWGR